MRGGDKKMFHNYYIRNNYITLMSGNNLSTFFADNEVKLKREWHELIKIYE